MQKHQKSLKILKHAAFTLAALLILVDFVSPGSVLNNQIINVEKERQNYYNAAGNYNYSYKVITSEHEFLVTEDFAKLKLEGEKIEYSVSRLFKQVNWYRLRSSDNKSYYSLRIASGLVLPFLVLISIFMAFQFKNKIGTLIFKFQVLLKADLLFFMT